VQLVVTGELSLSGKLYKVGQVVEKLKGSKQRGMKVMVILSDNRAQIDALPAGDKEGIDVVAAQDMTGVLQAVLPMRT